MRTSVMGMSRQEAEVGEVRDEGYSTEKGAFVIFDPKNPLAWIMSDQYGGPPDAEGTDDQGPTE